MKVRCPSCGNEVEAVHDSARSVLTCPRCQGEIPSEKEQREALKADELAPGIRRGMRIGAYEALDVIGSGGMAVVLKGRQLSLNRPVAIKVLPPRLSSNRLFLERFYGEAAALAELNHPNIVSVIDRGEHSGIYFIVMEYIPGRDLRSRLAEAGRLPQDEALRIALQVLAALEYAHAKGVIHRDIKPGNIVLGEGVVVKVADFGLAHLAVDRSDAAETRTGQTMGTLKYMAPEQLRSTKTVGPAADLYSVGVVLYEMLTGRLPVGAFRLPSEIIEGIDPRLDDIVLKALRADPEDRFASAKEFAEALQGVLTEPRAAAEDEFALRPDEAPPSIAACPKCTRQSPPDARRCVACGADLSHLFEPCPQCGHSSRLDVDVCPGCGFDRKQWLRKARHTVLRHQQKVKDLVAGGCYAEAVAELRRLVNLKGYLYEQVRESARRWMPKIERRLQIRNRQIFEAAVRMEAESNYAKAIELLDQLPPDYEGASALRRRAQERLEAGKAVLEQARLATERGDLDAAVRLWQEAASVWPRDALITNNLVRVKNLRADRRMARQYLDDAREAALKQNFLEALALCQRAQDLLPDSEEARALAERIHAEQAEYAAQRREPVASIDTGFRPPPRYVRLRKALKAAAAIAAIAGAVALFVFLAPTDEDRARRLINEAAALERAGDLPAARADYAKVLQQYGQTSCATEAKVLLDRVQALIARCDELEKRARDLLRQGDLLAAGKAFRALLDDPDCGRSLSHGARARQGLAGVVERLAQKGRAHAEAKEPDRALATLRSAHDLALQPTPELISLVQRAERTVREFDRAMSEARAALQSGDLDLAERSLATAGDIRPASAEFLDLSRTLIARRPPPPGMVLVPAGPFIAGADDGDPDEAPRREAAIALDYYLDVREVTNGEYLEYVRATGAPAPPHWRGGAPEPGTESLPVVNVTAAEAAAYAAWKGKRLPTEMEWERAARGADGRRYPWGDAWRSDGGLFSTRPSPSGTCPADVAPSGCREMAGNVSEWTADRWDTDDAWRVVRGGSWAGPEADRPVRPVFAMGTPVPALPPDGPSPAFEGAQVLADDPEQPVRPVSFERSVHLVFLGKGGSRDRLSIVVYRWFPAEAAWASARMVVQAGKPIADQKRIAFAEGAAPADVDFSTGCVLIGLRDDDEDVMVYAEPTGVRRELRRSTVAAPEGVFRLRTGPETLIERSVAHSARCSNRFRAPAGERFINVGFRCAATPALLQLVRLPADDASAASPAGGLLP